MYKQILSGKNVINMLETQIFNDDYEKYYIFAVRVALFKFFFFFLIILLKVK